MTKQANLRLLLTFLPLALPAIACGDDAPQPSQPAQGGNNPYVLVTGEREQESNYRIDTLQDPGPLGTTPILNQPYSISVLPQDLIENSQATDFKDVSKYLPLVAYQEQQGPEILRPQTRGMQGGNFQNTRLDGMQMFITVATAMEQFQEIQVVSGPTSSLFGPANPSGMFNFVSKRPTDHPLYNFDATYNSDGIVTGKMDVGGPIDSGRIFSYRLNGLYGSGDGWVEHSHERRALGNVGIDVRPWQRGVLELNYSNYSITNLGYPGWFTYSEKIDLPPAPDPTRVGYGQSYAGVDLITKMMWARFKQDFGSTWHFVAGILNQDASRNINTPVNNLTSDTGNYTSSFANGFAPRFIMTSDVAYLNNTFNALGMSHDLTLGTAGYKARSFSVTTPATPASVLLGKASIADPMIFPEPPQGPPNVLANYNSSNNYQQGLNIGDLIRFDSRWSTRLGVSQDWFSTNNYNKSGKEISEYSNRGLSPTGSLMFNPLPDQMAYFTYASSLQAGDLAPGGTVNAGQSLPPYRSKEYEVGYKAFLANINLTAAVFRIERPFANINTATNVFEISGEQVNRGLELSAVGELIHGFTLYGGLTLLDARMQNTPLPSTDDKYYVGAPKVKGNMLFEYAVPGVSGLIASFDYQFSGNRAGNDTNSFWVAGYNLFDIGVRYGTRHLTWRLAVNNVTDRHYWSTVAPSNLTGANTGNLIGHLGSPRVLLASVTLSL
ncbi:MAG TPA: TonB-dependent siderophore receptor [Steroidobacteraceae bacterium]|nr:TonB-dependent siderophore receptor [Steroidobacteraceae bacterium]